MIVGVPKEVKADEYRVAMLPVGVAALRKGGHTVLVQSGAGAGSGIADADYAGAEIVADAEEIFARADLVVKVKEPQPSEWPLIRPGQILFTYLHLAADERLTHAMIDSGAAAVAYETIGDGGRDHPLLTPMSEVAGRLSVQEGAKSLESPAGGLGMLLGGLPGVLPANVMVLGGGVVGANAAKMAAGLGANVCILDNNVEQLRRLERFMPPNVTTLFSDAHTVAERAPRSDLVIGAVLIPGSRAPHLITRAHLREMRDGSVIVDVAVDQGGCVETTRPTTHSDPTFVEEGVVHYCVANMPGAVGRTSTYGLCNVTLPYVLKLASLGLDEAAKADPMLARGVNVRRGHVTYAPVAETFGLPCQPLAA